MQQNAQPVGFGFYLLTAVLSVVFAGYVIFSNDLIPPAGQLLGNDSYMHLLRVQDLAQSWDWYNVTVPRNNAPYGMEMHWTRPFDLLLIAGAYVLTPFMGFEDGLYTWGIWIGPVLFVVVMLVLVWAAAPLLRDPVSRIALIPIAYFQPALLTLLRPGRPDHHNINILFALLALGFTIRLLMDPSSKRSGWYLGLVLGLAIWASAEALIVVVSTLVILAGIWLIRGGVLQQRCLECLTAFVLVVAVAMLLERPPERLFEATFDKVSAMHLLMGVLAAGFWATVGFFTGWGRGPDSFMRRGGLSVVVGGLVLGIMYICYPQFFVETGFISDPFVGRVYWDRVGELRSIWPSSRYNFARFVSYLGPTLIVVPYIAYRLYRGPSQDPGLWNVWLYLAAILLLFIPLAGSAIRFGPYAAAYLSIALAALIGHFSDLLGRVPYLLPRVLGRALLVLVCTTSFLLVRGEILKSEAPATASEARSQQGGLHLALQAMQSHEAFQGDPMIVLASPDFGPRILYFTPHHVVAGPYHRAEDGIKDALLVILAKSDEEAKTILDQRGVGAIMLLAIDVGLFEPFADGSYFYQRIYDGDLPDWLEEVELGDKADEGFKLFIINREEMGTASQALTSG